MLLNDRHSARRQDITNPLYRTRAEEFLADWAGGGLRGDCRDAFLGALPRSGKHALHGLTASLRAALKDACAAAYRAGYACAIFTECGHAHGSASIPGASN
jgi:hypothetical protein